MIEQDNGNEVGDTSRLEISSIEPDDIATTVDIQNTESTPDIQEAAPESDGVLDSDYTIIRPTDVPEKFWDQETGALRTENLLKSYLELEKKLGTMVPAPNKKDPGSRHRLERMLGKPDSPSDYQIEQPHELVPSDPEINTKLHDAGLSAEQAQLVYNLAAEHLVPIAEELNREAQQKIEHSKLAAHFGGDQKWQAIAPQMKTWAQANLPDDVFQSLTSSFDGVVALHQMMQAREPNLISEATVPSPSTDKSQLSRMMQDPRYWRDRDPTFIAEVTAGYKRLFG